MIRRLKILLIALYSDKYPSIGESHGTSVIAGEIVSKLSRYTFDYFEVIDMVIIDDKSIDNIKKLIYLNKPNIIGFSVNYGTYDILKEIFVDCNDYFEVVKPLVLFGGAISTYIPEELINNIYENAILVIGEGDETCPMVIDSWVNNKSFDNIPNLAYKNFDKIIYTSRKLVSVNDLSVPYRKHISILGDTKAQFYTESSRGCSWASCTFCLRGLTDVKGRKDEYRRFNIDRVTSDINELSKLGINVITFADEDFLGGNINENELFVDQLNYFIKSKSLKLTFDASLTVNSIYSIKNSEDDQHRIMVLLKNLKDLGLRKIFLGIESGSNTQLKRFAKGHSKEEILKAIDILKRLNYDLEIGFIMFDPLCSLEEIYENIEFLYKNDLTQYVSFLSNELRLQINSNFLKQLKLIEQKHNVKLINDKLDFNTISYNYNYLRNEVSQLIGVVQFWNTRIRDIHYPLKNLSRYGDGGILGKYRKDILLIMKDLRNQYLLIIKDAIDEIKMNGYLIDKDKPINKLLLSVSNDLLSFSKSAPIEILSNPIFSNILKVCNNEINSNM